MDADFPLCTHKVLFYSTKHTHAMDKNIYWNYLSIPFIDVVKIAYKINIMCKKIEIPNECHYWIMIFISFNQIQITREIKGF